METNANNIYVILSAISLLFSTVCFLALLKVFKQNKIPYQLEWLGQALLLFIVCQIYTIVKFRCFAAISLALYREVFYWIIYLTLIYLCLYSTKFVIKKCEIISRVFTFISHMALGASAVYLFMSIFILRMGQGYMPQSLNVYTLFYSFKPMLFMIETSILLVFNVYTWKILNFKAHVSLIKWTLQFCMTLFAVSYFVLSFTIFFIAFEVLILITIAFIMHNVFHERGRFLND